MIAASAAEAQADAAALDGPEAFDGSFRLETGEVVTGGYMGENGDRWVYMDTENLHRGGVRIDRILWREDGASLAGERVYPHTSEPVRFRSADGTELEGRLLLPRCEGPHPAVVAVHGSGPVNRYGGVFHTFFLKHGVAVLAYDKRGYTDDPSRWQDHFGRTVEPLGGSSLGRLFLLRDNRRAALESPTLFFRHRRIRISAKLYFSLQIG